MTKRSVLTNQVVKMNWTDFDKAGGGKKAGFNFVIEFKKGKVFNRLNSQLAKDLITVLQSDEAIMNVMAIDNFSFEMNPKCELIIRNN